MTIFSTSGCDSPMVGASLQENLASDEKKNCFPWISHCQLSCYQSGLWVASKKCICDVSQQQFENTV
jgi:hypothetical protein